MEHKELYNDIMNIIKQSMGYYYNVLFYTSNKNNSTFLDIVKSFILGYNYNIVSVIPKEEVNTEKWCDITLNKENHTVILRFYNLNRTDYFSLGNIENKQFYIYLIK